MLGLGLWFLAISGLRMSVLAFKHGQRLNAQHHQEQAEAATIIQVGRSRLMHIFLFTIEILYLQQVLSNRYSEYIHRQWHMQNRENCNAVRLAGDYCSKH